MRPVFSDLETRFRRVYPVAPGVSFFFQGVKVTKTQGFFSFNVACKWKRKILGVAPEEGWFILTNLDTLELA